MICHELGLVELVVPWLYMVASQAALQATSGVGLPSGQRMSFLVLGYLVPLLSACCDLHLPLLP